MSRFIKEFRFPPKFLNPNPPVENITLLYRATRDGTKSSDFHTKCDGKGPTLILAQLDNDFVVAAYCPVAWAKWSTQSPPPNAAGARIYALSKEFKEYRPEREDKAVNSNLYTGPSFSTAFQICPNTNMLQVLSNDNEDAGYHVDKNALFGQTGPQLLLSCKEVEVFLLQ